MIGETFRWKSLRVPSPPRDDRIPAQPSATPPSFPWPHPCCAGSHSPGGLIRCRISPSPDFPLTPPPSPTAASLAPLPPPGFWVHLFSFLRQASIPAPPVISKCAARPRHQDPLNIPIVLLSHPADCKQAFFHTTIASLHRKFFSTSGSITKT